MPKSKEFIDNSDDSSIESDEAPKKKKQKKTEAAKPKEENAGMYQLAPKRFINVTEWKGKPMINIREYYEDASGTMKPGKKGISLSLDQWKSLKDNMEKVDKDLEKFK